MISWTRDVAHCPANTDAAAVDMAVGMDTCNPMCGETRVD